MECVIKQGDISLEEADALVNAAGTSLVMGSGVAGALRRQGGEEINRDAVAKGPIGLGEAVVTPAYRLKAKYVIHAAAMPHYGDGRATSHSIREATLNALLKADELGCKTIAIPALGCGVAGFPLEEGLRLILTVIKDYRPRNLETCRLVLYTSQEYETGMRIAQEV
ncbi:MAG: Appr-1-p processing protein [Firmicutes bacterium]|jgi:O-acetyl-ADP-ribose deacetylase (regulator of RNase III)|nr:Appr-1-p processing protein [Bacillota bacterium]